MDSCRCACCGHVAGILKVAAGFPQISDLRLEKFATVVPLQVDAVEIENKLKGQLTFVVRYSLGEHVLPTKEARTQIFRLATQILEQFDGTLVRVGGGGWCSRAREYKMTFKCSSNGANKSASGTRKAKKVAQPAGADVAEAAQPPVSNASSGAPSRKQNLLAIEDVKPCCTYVRTLSNAG